MSEPYWVPLGSQPGAVVVYSQDADPGAVPLGSLWIETDVTAIPGPQWVKLTQAAYTALGGSVDPNTLYVIVG